MEPFITEPTYQAVIPAINNLRNNNKAPGTDQIQALNHQKENALDFNNYRVISLVPIYYEISANMTHNRCNEAVIREKWDHDAIPCQLGERFTP